MADRTIEYPLLLIDGNNLINRTYFTPGFQELETEQGLRIGALYGFFRNMFLLIEDYPQNKPIVCWDGGKSPKRLELLPNYKQREKKEDETGQTPLYEQIDMAINVLPELFGIPCLKFRDVEADDIIAFCSLHTHNSVIYSNDKDFAQLIRPGHSLVKSSRKGVERFTHGNYKTASKWKIYPKEVKLLLALMGDKADNVPGVPSVGQKVAQRILETLREKPYWESTIEGDYQNLKTVCQEIVESSQKRTWRIKKVLDHWEDFELSLKVVDLYRNDLLEDEQKEIIIQVCNSIHHMEFEKCQELLFEWEFILDLETAQKVINKGYVREESDLATSILDFL